MRSHIVLSVLFTIGLSCSSATGKDLFGSPDTIVTPTLSPTAGLRFDEDRIQQLMKVVDVGNNAITLKFGYFYSHRPQIYPVGDGYSLLKAELTKETPYSRRWFFLQSVRAYAAFRIGGDTITEGYEAYNDLFQHAERGDSIGAKTAILSAVYELVITMRGNHMDHRANHSRDQATLIDALHTYLGLARHDTTDTIQPPWSAAIHLTGCCPEATALIEETLADPAVPKTLKLLEIGASVEEQCDPARSIDLLKQARPLLSEAGSKDSFNLYNRLVTLLVDQKRLSEATEIQLDFVTLSGRGRARLADLYHQQKNETIAEATLAPLTSLDADEQDINDAAELLARWYGEDRTVNSKCQMRAIELLTTYLLRQHQREQEQDLRARLILSRILAGTGQDRDAKRWLDVTIPESSLHTITAKLYFDEMLHMLRKLETHSTTGDK